MYTLTERLVMFRKILLTITLSFFCTTVSAQQMVGESMSRFMNFANNGGRLTTYNRVQYQPYPIYTSTYDANGSEYRQIQKERSQAIQVLMWLGIDPTETELFSYYRDKDKTKN